MLYQNWLNHFFISLCAIATLHAFFASCTPLLYRNKAVGRLSHNQLRIKQGNATIEHRLNVFVHSFLFSFINLRLLLIAVIITIALNALPYYTT